MNDVLPVLKIQYRSDLGISEFLLSSSKVNQLKFSSLARADYNRRCIREECDFEVYSPPRARRIAKEVAIDYIRKYLDEQEDKFEASIDVGTGDLKLIGNYNLSSGSSGINVIDSALSNSMRSTGTSVFAKAATPPTRVSRLTRGSILTRSGNVGSPKNRRASIVYTNPASGTIIEHEDEEENVVADTVMKRGQAYVDPTPVSF